MWLTFTSWNFSVPMRKRIFLDFLILFLHDTQLLTPQVSNGPAIKGARYLKFIPILWSWRSDWIGKVFPFEQGFGDFSTWRKSKSTQENGSPKEAKMHYRLHFSVLRTSCLSVHKWVFFFQFQKFCFQRFWIHVNVVSLWNLTGLMLAADFEMSPN